MTLKESGDARGADVKTDNGANLAKFDSERQPDVAETDNGEPEIGKNFFMMLERVCQPSALRQGLRA